MSLYVMHRGEGSARDNNYVYYNILTYKPIEQLWLVSSATRKWINSSFILLLLRNVGS
jgi:hypothetical protein